MHSTPAHTDLALKNKTRPCQVAVLISGNGSNLQAIIDYSSIGGYQLCAVISNRADAFGLQRATRAGIATRLLDHKAFTSREAFDAQLMQEIDAFRPDLVVLAGFMRILSSGFVQHYAGRLLNIHPSLLPDYKGINTHQRVLDAGEPQHGVSVHFVTPELDGGPVIRQAVINVTADDTRDSLAQRVAIEEHKIYPEVIEWFASGRLTMDKNGVLLDQQHLPSCGIRTR
ncbi:phosphoribosylglycinamide formyltransferase [Pseudohongiella sp.]|uniref:phosphoribosylglycinamide formyltransferase n=1 Tax=Pseudohongiella sp. TaxID=1979412 RepID=UPI00180D85C3|nr:phosphoribosylglycinamide formyltransferase [Pseudohongiella sp.]HDZ09137.1 phosphoribosylglycinamide formyltransferase [Pseudohongiella sp.]HEA63527.1 phosphoribosylglycinamide formyltransferase [Pseudohongiella sp.]